MVAHAHQPGHYLTTFLTRIWPSIVEAQDQLMVDDSISITARVHVPLIFKCVFGSFDYLYDILL